MLKCTMINGYFSRVQLYMVYDQIKYFLKKHCAQLVDLFTNLHVCVMAYNNILLIWNFKKYVAPILKLDTLAMQYAMTWSWLKDNHVACLKDNQERLRSLKGMAWEGKEAGNWWQCPEGCTDPHDEMTG